ncbi:helix-turn-helix domain-containing protein [Helicobacter rodentium]|uniref:helix-turn-helix domain-containing protein n=1 Tax=Helicobacter rodentium TaxID=59617 RepID=UPI0023527546|nr:helix-turn-helix transcriptional regulator [Helicobacter rodentium]
MEFQALKRKALENKDFKKEWDAQAPLWKIQEQLIQARIKSNLTQQQIADKMQVAQSAVARFEKSHNGYNVNTLIHYAKAVGLKKIVIDL